MHSAFWSICTKFFSVSTFLSPPLLLLFIAALLYSDVSIFLDHALLLASVDWISRFPTLHSMFIAAINSNLHRPSNFSSYCKSSAVRENEHFEISAWTMRCIKRAQTFVTWYCRIIAITCSRTSITICIIGWRVSQKKRGRGEGKRKGQTPRDSAEIKTRV